MIHGGIGREDRRAIQESFLHDPEVQILLANDAASEGINLQRAHLMVNYDLPWNPKPHRAEVRAHSPNRADRGLSSLESDSGGDQGGRCLSHPAGET